MGRDVFPIMNLPEELFAKTLKMSLGDRAPQLLHKRRKRERGVVYWRSGPPTTYTPWCASPGRNLFIRPLSFGPPSSSIQITFGLEMMSYGYLSIGWIEQEHRP